MHRNPLAILALVATCLPDAAGASVVSFLGNETRVTSRTTLAGLQEAFFTGTDIPTSTLLSVSAPPGLSTNQISYFEQDSQTVFSNTLAATRDGSVGSLAGANASYIFSVAQDTHYALAGWFGVDNDGLAGPIGLEVELHDLDDSLPGYPLFWNQQLSDHTIDERFELGEAGGDRGTGGGVLKGAMQGTLLAGHSYRYTFNTASGTDTLADGGARSAGLLTLTLDTPNGIPEPGSLALLLGAGLAAGLCRSVRPRARQALNLSR